MPTKKAGGGLTEKDVARFEKELGAALPKAYRAFLLECNGRPEPERDIVFFAIQVAGRPRVPRDLRKELSTYGDRVPEDTLPIADDGGGNLFLLGKTGKNAGKVFRWSHEKEADEGQRPTYRNVKRVATTFDAFLASCEEADLPPPRPKPGRKASGLPDGVTLLSIPSAEQPSAKLRNLQFKEKEAIYRTARPGWFLAFDPMKGSLSLVAGATKPGPSAGVTVVVREGTPTPIALPAPPGQLFPEWSEDALLVATNAAGAQKADLFRVALPRGAATPVWSAPRGDGVLRRAKDSLGQPNAPFRAVRLGKGRLAVYTPARLVLLEERNGTFDVLAEQSVALEGLNTSVDGRFLLLERKGPEYALVAVRGRELRELARFTSTLRFLERDEGGIFVGDHGKYQALGGLDALYEQAFS